MSIAFVHLSDIHFGQEKGGDVVVHNDVKEMLIRDVERVVKTLPEGFASGIIVSGDIAYGGKAEQYTEAGTWLDRVAKAAGCAITDIQLVPGNHDIDREKISHGTSVMLQEVADIGEKRLDEFLNTVADCESLYARFAAYEPFARGYNSPLDLGGGQAGVRTVELAPNRFLRFIGLNTALTCATKDVKGTLLLGKRQRVLPIDPGHELVVIAHHPLDWLQDSEDARRYLTSRARVFISGHEHSSSVHVEPLKDGSDLMMLASGAAVPPTADGIYTYTYNVINFEWDAQDDTLVVTVHSRAWVDENKDFGVDPVGLNVPTPQFRLGCKYFREAGPPPAVNPPAKDQITLTSAPTDVPPIHEDGVIEDRKEPSVPAKYSLLRLRFFRDLTSTQRVLVLAKMGELPENASEPLTHAIEQQILDKLQRKERLEELELALNEIQLPTSAGESKKHD